MANLSVENCITFNNFFKKPTNFREPSFNFGYTTLKLEQLEPPLETLTSTEEGQIVIVDNRRCLHDGLTTYQRNPNTHNDPKIGSRWLILVDVFLPC